MLVRIISASGRRYSVFVFVFDFAITLALPLCAIWFHWGCSTLLYYLVALLCVAFAFLPFTLYNSHVILYVGSIPFVLYFPLIIRIRGFGKW